MFCNTKTKKNVIGFIRKGSSYKPLSSLLPADCLPSLISRDRNVQDYAVLLYNNEVESQVEKHSSGNIMMSNHIVVVSKTRTVKYLLE